MIEADGVGRAYRPGTPAEVRAVDGVSLVIPANSFAAFTGPSGSGKTTLLALLGGLDRPTAGRVVFAGRDLRACSEAELARVRRRVGFVFQDFALVPGLPVWENVTYPLVPDGVGRGERRRRAAAALAGVGLGDRLTADPADLSGGEQQRVAVARALIRGPEVILADEPTANLDDDSGGRVIELLRAAHRAGATVVAGTHDPRLAGIATLRFALAAGRLVS